VTVPDGDPAAADTPQSGADIADGTEPDYRFTLANERTLLAYLRTALALDAAGLAAVQFLTSVGSGWLRVTVGVLLTVAGTLAAIGGYQRWRSVQGAMRRGQPLPRADLTLLLAGVVALISVIAVVAVIIR
jgi:inner membrane protein YidH